MFLTSDQSRWVTGQTILADGGMSLGSVHDVAAPEGRGRAVAAAARRPQPEAEDSSRGGRWRRARRRRHGPRRSRREQPGRVLEGADRGPEPVPARAGGPLGLPPASTPTDHARGGQDVLSELRLHHRLRARARADGRPARATPTRTTRPRSGCATRCCRRSTASTAARATATPSSSATPPTAASTSRRRRSSPGWRTVSPRRWSGPIVPADEAGKLQAEIDEALRAALRARRRGTVRYLPHHVGRRAMDGVLPEDTELLMVDTACSSSLYAVDIGIKGLLTGRQDIAVCGGAFSLAPRGSVLFSKLHGLSASGVLRPLDKDADGVLFSDGAGVVVLKRLKRALEDGDTMLGVLKAFGSSSDGRGKAIYAPSSQGQRIAVERAHAELDEPARRGRLDHRARDRHAGRRPRRVHHAARDVRRRAPGLRHVEQVADRPHRLGGGCRLADRGDPRAPARDDPAAAPLRRAARRLRHRDHEPRRSRRRRSRGRPRTTRRAAVAISGFGFGGTNAHLVLEEWPSPAKAEPGKAKPPYAGRIAIVGWSACVPELEERDEVSAWLGGDGRAPAPTYGDFYPMPPFEKVRMPPAMIRTIDRCQLMVIECAHQLQDQLGDFWDESRARTGVIVGHMGATRSSTLYAGRSLPRRRRAGAARPLRARLVAAPPAAAGRAARGGRTAWCRRRTRTRSRG